MARVTRMRIHTEGEGVTMKAILRKGLTQSTFKVLLLLWFTLPFALFAQDGLEMRLSSMNANGFPTIAMNLEVTYDGEILADLDQEAFSVTEESAPQWISGFVQPDDEGGNRPVDIIFVLDVTGSMTDEIESVRQNMLSFFNSLANSGLDYNIGFVVFGDINYVYNDGNLYASNSQILQIINGIELQEHGIGSGGDEPENQLDALCAASIMNFRPGTHKVLILMTDATAHESDGVTSRTVASAIASLQESDVTVYPVFDTNVDRQNQQYIPIANALNTNGDYYHIYDSFNAILNDIGENLSNNYFITYLSNQPERTSIPREVRVTVSYNGETATTSTTYISGGAPLIRLTPETLTLLASAHEPGEPITISARITDNVEPYLNTVRLYYKRTFEDTTFNSVSMSMSGTASVWTASIPGSFVDDPGVNFYLTATDGVTTIASPMTHPSMFPYQLAVLPNTPVQITHTPPTEYHDGAVQIEADIVDSTTMVMAAYVCYRSYGTIPYEQVLIFPESGSHYSYTIPAEANTEQGLEYYILAGDNYDVYAMHGSPDTPHQFIPVQDVEGEQPPSASIPTSFTLEEIYPNPFNLSAAVRVHLVRSGTLHVTVYDIMGRAVMNLFSGTQSAGAHEFIFNGAGLSSGIYFVRASFAGEQAQVVKTTLVK